MHAGHPGLQGRINITEVLFLSLAEYLGLTDNNLTSIIPL